MPLSLERDDPNQWGFKIISNPIDTNTHSNIGARISKTRASTRQFIRPNNFIKRDSVDVQSTFSELILGLTGGDDNMQSLKRKIELVNKYQKRGNLRSSSSKTRKNFNSLNRIGAAYGVAVDQHGQVTK